MGELLGHGVRLGAAGPVMVAGEGIKTVLSLRMAVPHLPAIAALSAAHLAAIRFPEPLRRLYVAREHDAAGNAAFAALAARGARERIEILPLDPCSRISMPTSAPAARLSLRSGCALTFSVEPRSRRRAMSGAPGPASVRRGACGTPPDPGAPSAIAMPDPQAGPYPAAAWRLQLIRGYRAQRYVLPA